MLLRVEVRCPSSNKCLRFLRGSKVRSSVCCRSTLVMAMDAMSCYHGYYSDKGAKGVGSATTDAVVSSSILILLSNYLITELFFS